MKDSSTLPICTGPAYYAASVPNHFYFRPFSKLLAFEEQGVLLVTQVVPFHWLPTTVLVARAMPMATLQWLSLDLGLTLLLYSVATMLLVKGYMNRSGNTCE